MTLWLPAAMFRAVLTEETFSLYARLLSTYTAMATMGLAAAAAAVIVTGDPTLLPAPGEHTVTPVPEAEQALLEDSDPAGDITCGAATVTVVRVLVEVPRLSVSLPVTVYVPAAL